MLDKLDRIEKPSEVSAEHAHHPLPQKRSAEMTFSPWKAFPNPLTAIPYFENLDFQVKRGERVAIIGNNGTGKTTILKIINGLLEPDAGTCVLGSKVHIGYYDQEHHVLHMEKNLFQEISDDYPNLSNTEIRSCPGCFPLYRG